MSAKISILGLGIMGAAMARSAARGGLNTTAWDRSPERASSFAYDKVQIAQYARDAVQDAEIVVTMVSNADAVLSIMKEREVLPAMKPGAVWIQMSTIGVEGTERARRLAGTRPEIGFLDAPVSGSKAAAERGKLVILALADQGRVAATAQPFFGSLVPAWAVAKLQKIKEGRTAEREFPLRWAHKDVQLALAAAGEERARLPILNQIDSIWAEAQPGFGADDLSAIYLALSNGVQQ